MENNFSMGTSHRTGSEASARGRLGRQRGERLVTCCFFLSPCSPKKPWEFEDFKHHLVSFYDWDDELVFFCCKILWWDPYHTKRGWKGTTLPLQTFVVFCAWKNDLHRFGTVLIGFNWDWMKTAQESFKFERENLRIWVCRCACFHTWGLPDTYSKMKKK